MAQPAGAVVDAGGPDSWARARSLASQLTGAGGALASQIKTHAENLEKAGGGEPPAEWRSGPASRISEHPSN